MDYQEENWNIHLALFSNYITNFITLRRTGEYEPLRGYPVLEYYSSDARLMGGEFMINRRLFDNWNIGLQADYTHGSELQNGSWIPLPFMPPLRFAGKIGYESGNWWTQLQVRHVLKQNRTAPSEEETEGYTLTEASAGVWLGKNNLHNITLCGENLFNVTWRDHLSRIEQRDIPMMGRNIRLSYRYYF